MATKAAKQPVVCTGCRKQFIPVNANQVYCSANCKVRCYRYRFALGRR